MTDKVLFPTTIIPAHLYVRRDADRQLQKIIGSMGRPGYVLVSRQMGKTNLLLNAKRELENETLVFAYIDLSNRAPTAQGCFRSMVDTLIAALGSRTPGLANKLNETRVEAPGPAHREHEGELLEVLRSFPGKIVLILDEIDALTASDYSDEIFAQIRSVYFARVNYPDFDRLTYVLSGVVEPTKLIKDRNKSPFNIGEKIYLDDFSVAEARDFLTRTGLPFTLPVQDHIFSWVSGHPRMTWDICSELEDIWRQRGEVNVTDVDEVVDKLYLRNFDVAPVDHIRELVRSDSALRRAIRQINRGNSTGLSDNVKKKLYLAGVTQSDVASTTTSLKNAVIKASLSDAWLDSLEDLRLTLLTMGDEQRQLGNLEGAIRHYSEFVYYSDVTEASAKFLVLRQIGDCYSQLGQPHRAIEHYAQCQFDEVTQPTHYFEILFKIGSCHSNAKEYEDAARRFEEIIAKQKKSVLKCKALLNYAGCLLAMGFESNKDQALEIYKQLLAELSGVQFEDLNELNEIRTLSHYNIAQLSSDEADLNVAREHYVKALVPAAKKYQPAIYLNLVGLEEDTSVRNKLLAECHTLLVEHRVRLSTLPRTRVGNTAESILSFDASILWGLLLQVCRGEDEDLTAKYTELAVSQYFGTYESPFHLLGAVASIAFGAGYVDTAISIGERIMRAAATVELNDQLLLSDVHRLLGTAKYRLKGVYITDLRVYIRLFREHQNFGRQLVSDDIYAFLIAVIEFRQRELFKEALDACLLLKERFKDASAELQPSFLGIFFFLSQLYDEAGDIVRSLECARETLRLIPLQSPENDMIGAKQVENIRVATQTLIEQYFPSAVQKSKLAAIPRNARCPCGSGKKYKDCCGKSASILSAR